ncbi:uncharacterized protein LOC143718474 [Siphateles boraxobius]|uniref:uncharacterized protein LOC143718474 n=1 Tax=Siphateles boraxobius TaxID=180520 RepID=UPI0040634FF7
MMIIEESFPLLRHAGGFKLMRCCRSRQLIDIAMPTEGYSVEYLKETSNLNKAVAYIVPLQCDLPLNGDIQKVDSVREGEPLKQTCVNCKQQVALHVLESHKAHCITSIAAKVTDSTSMTPDTLRCNTWSMRITLMLTHQITFNCWQAEEVKVVKVPKNLTEAGFQEFLRAIYPQLERINFDLCKVNRHRVVVPLTQCTPHAIRSSGVLGCSALYIRPEHDINTDGDSDITEVISLESDAEEEKTHGTSENETNISPPQSPPWASQGSPPWASPPQFSPQSPRQSRPQFSPQSPRQSRPQFSSQSPRQFSPQSPLQSRPQFSPQSPRQSRPQFSPQSPRQSRPQFSPQSPRQSRPQFSPLSPRQFSPLSPRKFSPLSPRKFSPLSPRQFPPRSPRQTPPRFSPESPRQFSPQSPRQSRPQSPGQFAPQSP